jgi:hypothetical protein
MEGLIQSNIADTPPEDCAEAPDAASAAAPSAPEDKSALGDPSDKPSGASSKRIRGPKRRTKTGCLSMSSYHMARCFVIDFWEQLVENAA